MPDHYYDADGEYIPLHVNPAAPTVREVDGILVVDWPEPRPRWFQISAEAFQLLIDRANGRAGVA